MICYNCWPFSFVAFWWEIQKENNRIIQLNSMWKIVKFFVFYLGFSCLLKDGGGMNRNNNNNKNREVMFDDIETTW